MGLFSRKINNIFDDEEFMRREMAAGDAQPRDYDDIIPDTVEQPGGPKSVYGIQDAMKLLRSVPKSDLDVVLTVVKQTLESMNVRVADIIRDAEIKEKGFNQLLSSLRAEVMDYQSKVKTKRQEIVTLEAVLKETTAVKNRLIYVENLNTAEANIPVLKKPAAPNAEVLNQDQDQDQENSGVLVNEAELNDREIDKAVRDQGISTSAGDVLGLEDIEAEKNSADQVQQDTLIETKDSIVTKDFSEIDLDDTSIGQVLEEAIKKSKSAAKVKTKSKRKTRKKTTA